MENSISPNIEQVRLTADDAILSKMYAFVITSFHRACVDKGYYTDQVAAKISSVTDRAIKVLYQEDLKYAFDWVKQHYTYSKLEDLYESR